jgi:hypothetical protein
MTTKVKQKQLVCVLVSLLLGTFVPSVYAETMLDRVLTVDDPELGECLRAAIKHVPTPTSPTGSVTARVISIYHAARNKADARKIEITRAVTESYAQIKLLDSQIDQIDKRLKMGSSANTPNALHHELMLARAELESKRIQELAKLRETMGIIPRHAFGEIQLGQLTTAITLDVLDEQHVLVFQGKKPFKVSTRNQNCDFLTLITKEEVPQYMGKILQSKEKLPLRVDILRREDSRALSETVHAQLIQQITQSGTELETDVRSIREISRHPAYHYYCIKGEIGTGYSSRQNGGGNHPYLLNISNEKNLMDRVLSKLSGPTLLPVEYIIEYDDVGLKSAEQTANTIKKLAEEQHISDLVTVTLEPTKRTWYERLRRP